MSESRTRAQPMGETVLGVIEQFFDRLVAGDWTGLGALLAPDVERIGPWGDRMVGRDRYIEMMTASNPTGATDDDAGSTWEVHRIAYGRDGRSGFARVTAHPSQGPISEFEETLAFLIDDRGLVSVIEVFWQTAQQGFSEGDG